MTPCRTCHATGPHQTVLVRDDTGDRMTLCPPCLRTATRMQADARDDRGRRRLADHAELHGLQLWTGEHVAYVLMPPTGMVLARPADPVLSDAPRKDRMTRVTVPHA